MHSPYLMSGTVIELSAMFVAKMTCKYNQQNMQVNKCLMSVWKSDEKLLIFASLILFLKSFFFLRSNIKHLTQCFITRWNTLKFIKYSVALHINYFSTLFSVLHPLIKHSWFIIFWEKINDFSRTKITFSRMSFPR